MRPGMEIDFGGIGKEYAVDQALATAAAITDAPVQQDQPYRRRPAGTRLLWPVSTRRGADPARARWWSPRACWRPRPMTSWPGSTTRTHGDGS